MAYRASTSTSQLIMKPQKGRRIRWFADEDSPEDRRILTKLDLLILPFAMVSCWTKFIDQANINNAYVSGLKEDLGLYGNQLIQLHTIYSVGAVVGQLPFMFLLSSVPLHWLIPTLDISWGLVTLLQYRSNSFAELAAYRFLIGWFEAAFAPAMHFLFGSWYRSDEIARRGGIFYLGGTLGTIVAGLIQAGASARLDGVHGLAGWRWMYIICAVITIPVGIAGYILLPGTPSMPNNLLLSEHELHVRKVRLEGAGHTVSSEKVTLQTLKQLAGNPLFWMLLMLEIFYWNASLNAFMGGFLLWLKSLGRYSIPRVNALGTIVPTVGIFYTIFICLASDLFIGPAWAITVSHLWNIIGLIILIIWDVPESALWFAFITTYSSVAMSTVLYGWVNHQLRSSPAKRSFTLVLITAISQSTFLWTQLLTFPTVEAPRFTKGYSFVLANAICLIILSQIVNMWLKRRS
ncbi:major facilitator superfamily domain-containing protein [Hypoxylon sp. FL1857]|nr:major facilitator superfamily domain-containing protein [Hypoxylon sp. FL1857]